MAANDLNPASHEYLVRNIHSNKADRMITAYCMDGRAFIRQCCAGWPQASSSPGEHHILVLVDICDLL